MKHLKNIINWLPARLEYKAGARYEAALFHHQNNDYYKPFAFNKEIIQQLINETSKK